MKKLVLILSFLICTCTPERHIEVRAQVWTLIRMEPADRYGDQEPFLWLIWESNLGVEYKERMTEDGANYYWIGMKITNRI